MVILPLLVVTPIFTGKHIYKNLRVRTGRDLSVLLNFYSLIPTGMK